MKKIIFVLFIVTLLSSCEKENVNPHPYDYYGGSQDRGVDHYIYDSDTTHKGKR